MSTWKRLAWIWFGTLVLGFAPLGAALAQVKVTAATPSSAYQGTIALDVVVSGSGFDKSAKVQYFVTGTTNPGGITVRNVRFNSSRELVTTIDVADTADLASFDIIVTLDTGRKGKGTTLFKVLSSSSKPDTYTGESLGTLSGDTQSEAWDVNSGGNVVGRSISSGQVVRAFYWNGAMRELPMSTVARNTPPLTAPWSVEATGISNGPAEIAVGFERRDYCESKSGPCYMDQYPVVWEGGLQEPSDAKRLDVEEGVAFGINPAGNIVVGYSDFSAAIWEKTGGNWVRSSIPLTAFECPACEFQDGGGSDVNDAGIVVGYVTRAGDYLQFAFVYDIRSARGKILPLPAGYVHSNAYSISNVVNGNVHVSGVVKDCPDSRCDGARGIRWTIRADTLAASSEILSELAWSQGVTDQGAVAGTKNSKTTRRGSVTQTATLWRQSSGYTSLLPAGGSDSWSRAMAAGLDGTLYVVGGTPSKGMPVACRWVIR